MRHMTPAKAAAEITRAYNTHRTQNGTTPMSTRQIVESVDLTIDEITAGVLHLMGTVDTFAVAPESNQKALTAEDRACALWIGNQDKHYISWK